ncbi:MAG: hypothetical protein V3V24_09805 [Nitrospinaceae bacterium]
MRKISDERLKELAALIPCYPHIAAAIDENIYMAQELELYRKVVKAVKNYKMDFRPVSEALSDLDKTEEE